MHCHTCGAPIPSGRRECGTCGSTPTGAAGHLDRTPNGAHANTSIQPLTEVLVCRRCGYRGSGLSYFSRGQHMAGLVVSTVVTLPMLLGAGGLLYYWLRHDHRVCPRCGVGWGKGGETALVEAQVRSAPQPMAPAAPAWIGEGGLRSGSIALAVLGAILLIVGVTELEGILVAFGALSGIGAFGMHRGANAARERRREALLSTLQLNVLRLAGERRGRLTVTEVAASLAWPIRRAEKVLHSLDDGLRVNSEVTDEGVIIYEFRELLRD